MRTVIATDNMGTMKVLTMTRMVARNATAGVIRKTPLEIAEEPAPAETAATRKYGINEIS